MSHRVFIAINLPPEVKNELEKLIFSLAKEYHKLPIKWVEKNNLHLTLHFLGSQDQGRIEQISEVLNEWVAQFPVLDLKLGQLGVFPYLDRPRVIYLELKERKGEALKSLQKNLGEELEKLDIDVDHRPWRPHVTLARIKALVKIELPEVNFNNLEFKVDKVDLMESDLQPQGPNYKVLKEFGLKRYEG